VDHAHYGRDKAVGPEKRLARSVNTAVLLWAITSSYLYLMRFIKNLLLVTYTVMMQVWSL
jgi:hypothetical protein